MTVHRTVKASADAQSGQLARPGLHKAIDGVVYEAAGIPVDIALAPADDATFESYVRSVMDAAIARSTRIGQEPSSAASR